MPVKNPDHLIVLARKVYARHKQLGKDSPLINIDMEGLIQKAGEAEESLGQARTLHARAEALSLRGYSAIGSAKGQSSLSAGTMYNRLTIIRDLLLSLNKGLEENLSEWGFNIVISETFRKRGGMPPAPGA